jgi:hypothetical protein
LETTGRTEEALLMYTSALECAADLQGTGDTSTKALRSATLRLATRGKMELRSLTVIEATALTSDRRLTDPVEYIACRALALEMYLLGLFDDAEALYMRLAVAGWDLSSTYTHLARLHLTMRRTQEAASDLTHASAHIESAQPYVRARIIFFKLLLAMLAQEEAETRSLTTELRRALSD